MANHPYNNKRAGYWLSSHEPQLQPRAKLNEDIHADIAIVGAGFTGLWTAWYLKKHAPQLSIAVLEAEVAGFGASGRNGGWLMGSMEGVDSLVEGLSPSRRQDVHTLCYGIIDEVRAFTLEQNLDCDLQQGGAIYAAARYPEQLESMQELLAYFRSCGYDESAYHWLSKDELAKQLRIKNGYGGIYTPHVAAINPAKLVRGLAVAVEQQGVVLYEHSAVTGFDQSTGLLKTVDGSVRADRVVLATEGFNQWLTMPRRYVLPIQSQILVTEPLTDALWDEIGLDRRQVFADGGRQSIYGQKTADKRLVFGARASYLYGGQVRYEYDLSDPSFNFHKDMLLTLFPMLSGSGLSCGWGGTLGVPRKFRPHAIFDPGSGIAMAGGYGGEGVGASNLIARTLVDLILERQTGLSNMPWAHRMAPGKALRRWEPEPFRWLMAKLVTQFFAWEEQLLSNPQAADWKKKMIRKTTGQLARIVHLH